MVWLQFLLLVTAFILPPVFALKKCHQEHIHYVGKKHCEQLVGDFIFDTNTTCDKHLYENVVRLTGTITFRDLATHDPLQCMPKLDRIFLEDDKPAINIMKSVVNMERFSWNPALIIVPKKDDYKSPFFKIEADFFRMSYDNYKSLVTRFGSKNVELANKPYPFECDFEGVPLKFLSQLDDCEIVVGNLIIDNTLQASETNTQIHTIEGCLRIRGTNLEITDLSFLMNVRYIGCDAAESAVSGNLKLCPTPAFMDHLASIHKALAQDIRLQLINSFENNNGAPSECEGLCSAENIHNEGDECKTLWGDLYLRESIASKLKHVTTLKGRLLVYGYGGKDLFKALPSLRNITSNTQLPAIEVSDNRVLNHVEFPDNLTIASSAPTIIQITGNFFFKMSKEQYNKLAKKYGKDKLKIDVLEDRECYFPDLVKDLKLLDNCETVHGHLKMKNYVEGSTANQIKVVTGCISINGTNLEYLDFLRRLGRDSSHLCNEAHAIVYNKNLCAQTTFEILKGTQNHFAHKRIKVYGNKQNCGKHCDRDHLFMGGQCTVVNEGITISPKEKEPTLVAMASLEEVYGPIRIRFTNISDFSVFHALRTVNVPDDEPGIEIRHNNNMSHIDFPYLKNINSNYNSSKLIVIRDNGDYVMPYKQYMKLVEQFGEDRLDIDHEVEHSHEFGFWIGISLSIAIGLITAAVVLGIIAINVARQKKKDSEETPLLDDAIQKNMETNDQWPAQETQKACLKTKTTSTQKVKE